MCGEADVGEHTYGVNHNPVGLIGVEKRPSESWKLDEKWLESSNPASFSILELGK